VDRAADLGTEDLIHEPVLLDARAARERRRRDGCAEVVAAACVVLDLGARPRDRVLDALLDVVCRGHFVQA
jgi:hypothetical protein